jgi:ribosome-associated toxin RatA of RatAB toxin-antitoxin module
MSTINRSMLVPYSAAEMFALVNDIESYGQFLPWCESAKVLWQEGDELRASIELARGNVRKSFTTRNRLQADKMIEMRLEEGPFHHLEGFWRFDRLGESACKVSLDMEFEFSSKLVGLAFGPIFTQVVNNLVDAFLKRAVEVYGKR